MAREIRTYDWCDVCLEQEIHEPGTAVIVALDGGKPRAMDLCDADRKALLGALTDALEAFGHAPDGIAQPRGVRKRQHVPTAAAPGAVRVEVGPEAYPFRCPLCDRPEPTGSALGAHLRSGHETNFAETYGAACAVCGTVMASPSGIGMHLVKSHSVTGGTAVAFEWARANGDPAGVVAERLAAWAR
jgi:hypothetical protein